MIPYDPECVTRLLRRMTAHQLAAATPAQFQVWPAQVVTGGALLREIIATERRRRAA